MYISLYKLVVGLYARDENVPQFPVPQDVYIKLYTHINTHIHIYIYIYIYTHTKS